MTGTAVRAAVEPIASVDYLVAGARISLGPDSTTPGPRTHILNVYEQLQRVVPSTHMVVASDIPPLRRATTIAPSDLDDVPPWKIRLADVARVVAAGWVGLHVATTSARRRAPDVIYERSAVLQSMSSFHARRRRALRVVEVNGIMSRETAQDRNVLRSVRLATWLERRVIASADLVVTVSSALADEVIEFTGVDAGDVLVVPNGVPAALAQARRHDGTGPKRFGFAGSLATWQRLDRVVDVLTRLQREGHTDWVFEVIGDGIEHARLAAHVEKRGLGGKVVLLGRLPQQQTIDRMLTWDVGLAGHERSSSKRMYHSPLKVYEYAAAGLEIVCTPSDDARSLERSGVPVRYYTDERQLFAALASVAGRPRRPSTLIESQRAAVLADHGWDVRVQVMLDEMARRRAIKVGAAR